MEHNTNFSLGTLNWILLGNMYGFHTKIQKTATFSINDESTKYFHDRIWRRVLGVPVHPEISVLCNRRTSWTDCQWWFTPQDYTMRWTGRSHSGVPCEECVCVRVCWGEKGRRSRASQFLRRENRPQGHEIQEMWVSMGKQNLDDKARSPQMTVSHQPGGPWVTGEASSREGSGLLLRQPCSSRKALWSCSSLASL